MTPVPISTSAEHLMIITISNWHPSFPVPNPLKPSGPCVLQNDTCSWTGNVLFRERNNTICYMFLFFLECDKFLNFCLFSWICGMTYDARKYYAGPPYPCPHPPLNYSPPPPKVMCEFNLMKRACNFDNNAG